MMPHILRIIGMGAVTLGMLGLAFYVFEKIGARIGFFLTTRGKLVLVAVGLVIVAALNGDVFIYHEMKRTLQMVDFGFFLAFVAFCYGMFQKRRN